MIYKQLKKYVLPNENDRKKEIYKNFKHHFFPISDSEIELVKKEIEIPFELEFFYRHIGYGFFFQNNKDNSDRLLDAISFKQINLRQDYYKYDPDMELYNSSIFRNKYIFFELCEGTYLHIDKKAIGSQNAIYFFERKIANSLEDFLLRFNKEGHYFERG